MKLITFVDDIALVAKTEQDLKTIMNTLVEESDKTK